jgi:hypothetical protein
MDCSSIYCQTILPMLSDGPESEGEEHDIERLRCESPNWGAIAGQVALTGKPR